MDFFTSFLENASSLLRDALPHLLAKEDQGLVLLRVSLTFPEGEPEVEMDLTPYGIATKEAGRRTWRIPFSVTQAPTALTAETEPQLQLPLQVKDGLRASLAGMKEAADQPLWLDLMRPYGYLGVVPWERVLGDAVERPVLRLPDFLEPPREAADVLEAAVIFDPPSTAPVEKAIAQVRSIAEGIVGGCPRLQTRVNVFATPEWNDRLRSEKFDSHVRLHDPARALPSATSLRHKTFSGELQPRTSTWTNWISLSMERRSIDAVHFVCPAEVSDSAAGLVLSSSPSPQERPVTLILADADELGAMLTRIGAWTAMFSPPPDGSSGARTAFVADAFAHSRPGPVLYHCSTMVEDPSTLLMAYRLLFASSPSRAPKIADGFVYCYPGAVAGHASFAADPILETVGLTARLINKRASLSDRVLARLSNVIPGVSTHEIKPPPNWVGAAQRYVESAALDELRRTSADVLLSRAGKKCQRAATGARTSDADVVQETLSDIQKAVGDYLQKSSKP